MNNATTPITSPTKKLRLSDLEPYARKGLLACVAGLVLLALGQYTGASAISYAFQQERMNDWASRSPANAAALAEFLSCDRSGPELTRQACLARSSTGQLALELDDVTTAPALVSQVLPAPLRWFLG